MNRGLVIFIIILTILFAAVSVFIALVPFGSEGNAESRGSTAGRIDQYDHPDSAPRASKHENNRFASDHAKEAGDLWFAVLVNKTPAGGEIVKLSKKDLGDDPDGPFGQGRTAGVMGWVSMPKLAALENSEVQIEFIHGLNAGRKETTARDGSYQMGRLYPGLNIVRFSSGGRRAVDVEMLLKSEAEIRQDVSLGERGSVDMNICNTAGVPLRSGLVTVAGELTKESGRIHASGPDCIATISAKGYESLRHLLHLPGATSQEKINITLRRAGSLEVSFDSIGTRYVRATALLLPSSVRISQKYPFESAGVVRAENFYQEIEFLGVPHEEPFDICLFANDAIAVPALIHLKGIDSSEPVARTAKFSFEERSIVTGRLMSRGMPVIGATIRAEVHDVALAMRRMFQDHGGLDRVALPILPFARRIVTSDFEGKFRVETFDMIRPATIMIEAAQFKRRYLPLPSQGGSDLGDIDMNPDGQNVDEQKLSSLTFEFPDEKARTLKLYTLSDSELIPDSKCRDTIARIKKDMKGGFTIPCSGKRSGAVSVVSGNYVIFAGPRDGETHQLDLKIDGAASVPIR